MKMISDDGLHNIKGFGEGIIECGTSKTGCRSFLNLSAAAYEMQERSKLRICASNFVRS